jgi:hypothetical protein
MVCPVHCHVVPVIVPPDALPPQAAMARTRLRMAALARIVRVTLRGIR